MDTELIAVTEVNSAITRCPRLRAFIAANDKTPLTDGHIDLYNDLSIKKEHLVGRVTVQVKGQRAATPLREEISYSVERTALEFYMRDSGILYLAVLFNAENTERHIYYALLSPFVIETYLDRSTKKRKSVSVKLRPLPPEPHGVEGLIALAIKTKSQNPQMGFDPSLMEKMKSITLHSATPIDFDKPFTLETGKQDFALIVNTDAGMSIPMGGIISFGAIEYPEAVDLKIACGGIEYPSALRQRLENGAIRLRVSEGLSVNLRLEDGTLSGSVNLTLESDFESRLRAVTFYLAMMEGSALYINGEAAPFEVGPDPEVSGLRSHLNTLEEMNQLFERLHIDPSQIDMDLLDKDQLEKLQSLHAAFVGGEEIALTNAKPSRVLETIGGRDILFLIKPGGTPGNWVFVNLFDPKSMHLFRRTVRQGSTETTEVVTSYEAIEPSHLLTAMNLNLRAIVGAYSAIAEQSHTHTLANLKTLDLLAAADLGSTNTPDLLNAALALSEWLIREQPDHAIHRINRWQTMVRLGVLSSQERDDIRALRRRIAAGTDGNADPDEVLVACALLLGEREEADYLIGKLPVEQQDRLKAWPLWSVRDRDSNATTNG